MKKTMLMMLLPLTLVIGCEDDKQAGTTPIAMDICSLITQDEAEQLIGKKLAHGETATTPLPDSKVCVWKNEKGAPELFLHYFPGKGPGFASFALPGGEVEPFTMSGGEGAAIWTAKDSRLQDHQTLVQVVVKDGHSAFNLNVIYADTARGSEKARQMMELAKQVLDRSH